MPVYSLPEKPFYRIAQLSDCHLLAASGADYKGIRPAEHLQQIVTVLQSDLPDAVLLTGDLTQDHSIESYRHVQRILQVLSCPVFCLPGNHDDPQQLAWLTATAPFRPETHLRLGKWHLLLLNTKSTTPAGRFDETQQQWLQQQLATIPATDTVWLFCHHHPRPLGCFIDKHGQQDEERLWQTILADRRIKGIAHGHSHYAYHKRYQLVDIVGCPATSVQFLPTADWQTENKGPQWCEWHFADTAQVNWQFKGC